ncbi:MAG: hypothetical protein ACKVU0_19605, partial [Saprospiraceae bacterium]
MNSLSIFSKYFSIAAAFVLTASISVQAQNPVESTHIDEKYAYTTVVYKNTAATDKDVLSSLEKDFGIGDVVRVTLAPPPTPIAASEPVYADKRKGEDVWMPGSTKAVQNLTASANFTAAPKTSINSIATAPKPAQIAAKVAAPKPVIVAKTIAATVPEEGKTVTAVPDQGQKENASALPTTSSTGTKIKSSASGKSAKAHKSSRKSDKKGSQKKKLKNRKQGKQRYSCPKF